MFIHFTRRPFAVLPEIAALLIATAGLSTAELSPAVATTSPPVVAFSVNAPAGITIDSPWVIDATGATAWALGASTNGNGVLVRRDLQSTAITTTPTVTGEVGATDGELITPTGQIIFLAKRAGTGGRIVAVDPISGTRTWGYDLTATDTTPLGIGYTATGSTVLVGSNTATPRVVKITAATGAYGGAVAVTGTRITSGFAYGPKLFVTTGDPTARLIAAKDATSAPAVDSTTTLTGLTHTLTDALVQGSTIWFGTESGAARLVGMNVVSKTITSNAVVDAAGVGLRNLTLAADGLSVFGTTERSGRTHLLRIRTSDSALLASVDLGPVTAATSIAVVGRYVDVTFPGQTALIRTTTAAPPEAPVLDALTPADSSIAVEWTPGASEEPLVNFRAETSTGDWCSSDTGGCTISGLTNGTTYSVHVTATSFAGTTASAVMSATPATLPDPPRVVLTERGDEQIAVHWAPGDDGGRPIDGYTVELHPGGLICETTEETCVFSGLVNGSEHFATVTAHTAWGDSAPSEDGQVVRPARQPDAPLAPIAVRDDRSVHLTWHEPADQGEPVIGYVVTHEGMPVCETVDTSCTVANLRNGNPVTFAVMAVNVIGSSEPSDTSIPVVPATVPDSPAAVTVIDAVDSSTVTWQEPDDGGEPVEGYTVRVWLEATEVRSVSTPTTTWTFGDGRFPDSYRITIEAINVVGASARSVAWLNPLQPPPVAVVPESPVVPETPVVPESPVVPETPVTVDTPVATVPASPYSIRLASVTTKSYTLTWSEPSSGGSPITDYAISTKIDGRKKFSTLADGRSIKRTAKIPRPRDGKSVYVKITAVNAVGKSVAPGAIKLKGKKLYTIPSVVAVRERDAAAFAGSLAKSTPYDGTSRVNVGAQSTFL